MRARKLAAVLASLLASGAAVWSARAERMVVMDLPPPDFVLQGPALGGARPPAGADLAAPAHLVGGPIAALDDGALIVDAESGDLIRTDATGAPRDRLAIGKGAPQLVYEPKSRTAYVADRAGDRVVVVEVGAKLAQRAQWTTPAEPFGLALSPDAGTLLVTTVAARTLVAFDTGKGRPRWQRPLAAEPRGVAISPDGTLALVSHLTTGTATRVDLAHDGAMLAIPLATKPRTGFGVPAGMAGAFDDSTPGRTFARNGFTARFVGNGLALVPHQRSTPSQELAGNERAGAYGGGFDPPIEHAITFIAAGDAGIPRTTAATISAHQPQATAWDPMHDRLLVAGFGSDRIVVIDGASQAAPWLAGTYDIALDTGGKPVAPGDGTGTGCGPQGLALDGKGGAWVYCAVSHTTAHVAAFESGAQSGPNGPALGGATLTAEAREGFDLFRRADARISMRGAMACANCHPEGRDDGLSWRIEGHALQTPLLAGRVTGTGPYKWDGTDATLADSMTSTMRRLGGAGLDEAQTAALAAYVSGLARPRAPVRDAAQVARGEKIFDSEGCRTCHSDGVGTDRERHDVGGSLPSVDTPSLIGVAASAPYYHDGSAATLQALLGGRGLVHGMTDAELDSGQVADLIAYLETL
ncbi:MAG TPA: c-type cytochrome [Kofleriaceae bacterium]|nr:c-type cytochrome [Kofleriaceae bacterium]